MSSVQRRHFRHTHAISIARVTMHRREPKRGCNTCRLKMRSQRHEIKHANIKDDRHACLGYGAGTDTEAPINCAHSALRFRPPVATLGKFHCNNCADLIQTQLAPMLVVPLLIPTVLPQLTQLSQILLSSGNSAAIADRSEILRWEEAEAPCAPCC